MLTVILIDLLLASYVTRPNAVTINIVFIYNHSRTTNRVRGADSILTRSNK